MGRRRALSAKVILGFDESAPEVLLPNAIDGYSSRERVVGGDEPSSKVEAIWEAC